MFVQKNKINKFKQGGNSLYISTFFNTNILNFNFEFYASEHLKN